MKNEIKDSKSVSDILKVVAKYYDLDNATPGHIVKMNFAGQLEKTMMFLGAKEK